MSVYNLNQGLRFMTDEFKERRERKKANEKELRLRKARAEMADAFGGTMAGKTEQGQMIKMGLESELIDANSAIKSMPTFTKEESLMMLHTKMVNTKDPAERRILMEQINYLTGKFNAINEMRAYYKARGGLAAKGEFGQLKGMGGGKGGGGSGGGTQIVDPGADPNNPDYKDTVPYSIELKSIYTPLRDFLQNDDLYGDEVRTNFGKGTVEQDWENEDRNAFRERLNNFFFDRIQKTNPELSKGSVQHLARNMAYKAGEVFEQKGVDAFLGISKAGGQISPLDLTITERVPKSVLFPYEVHTKGRKKGSPKGRMSVNPDKYRGYVVDQASAIAPPWLKLKGENSKKSEEELKAEADYYLK